MSAKHKDEVREFIAAQRKALRWRLDMARTNVENITAGAGVCVDLSDLRADEWETIETNAQAARFAQTRLDDLDREESRLK